MAKPLPQPRLLISSEVSDFVTSGYISEASIGKLLLLLIEQFESDDVTREIPPEIAPMWKSFKNQVIRNKEAYAETVKEREERRRQAKFAADHRWGNAPNNENMRTHTDACERMQTHTDEMQPHMDACERMPNSKGNGINFIQGSGSEGMAKITKDHNHLFSDLDYAAAGRAAGWPEEEVARFVNKNKNAIKTPEEAVVLWELRRTDEERAGGTKAIGAKQKQAKKDAAIYSGAMDKFKAWVFDNGLSFCLAKQGNGDIKADEYARHLSDGMSKEARQQFRQEATAYLEALKNEQ